MPRARQSEEQREIVRRRILAAAQDLFNGAGIDAVSMRSLGARVGLTAPALYAYFPAKLDLLRALWWDALDDLHGRMARLSESEPDPVAAIRALGLAYVDFGLENPPRFRVLFMADRAFAEELKAAGIAHEAYGLFLARVSEAIDRGRLRPGDPDLYAQALWAGAHGVVNLINSSTSFSFVSPSLLAATTIGALLAGLEADRPTPSA